MSAVSFPYPILGVGDDYIDASFQVALRKLIESLRLAKLSKFPSASIRIIRIFKN